MPNDRMRSAPTTTTNAGISRPDAAINDDLLEAGVPVPDGVVTPAMLGLAEGDIEEVYYAALSQQAASNTKLDDALARPVTSPYVFSSFQARGRSVARSLPTARPMDPSAVWRVVRDYYAEVAGLAGVKPHDFRRFVGTQLAAGDIRKAQMALGHKRIDTTARYYVLDELEPRLTDDLY
jgi:integrase